MTALSNEQVNRKDSTMAKTTTCEAAAVWGSELGVPDAKLMIMPENINEFEPEQRELDAWAEVYSDCVCGLIKDPARLPSQLCGYTWDTRIRKLKHFNNAYGFPLVSEAFANVLRKYDLGGSGFHPVDIYHGNRRERIDLGNFFILYPGATKDTFQVDKVIHDKFSVLKFTKLGRRFAPWSFEDQTIVLSKNALNGADFWIEKQVGSILFFGSRLVEALRVAKLDKDLKLKACAIAD